MFIVKEKKAEESTNNEFPTGFCVEGCDANVPD